MKAPSLIDGAAFGPETLKVIGEAFDQAWSEIGDGFNYDELVIEAARLNLAVALLSVAAEGNRDVATLKADALEAMARDNRANGENRRRQRSWVASRSASTELSKH